jgi:very-short-patch-repair endonuclease/transposase
MRNSKTNSKNITKEQLGHLYRDKKMTLDEIGIYFGYADRQPIIRLFKKFNIKSRTKAESADVVFENRYTIPLRDELKKDLETMSVSKAAKKYNIHRGSLTKIIKKYGLGIDYSVNLNIKENINKEEYKDLSPIELSSIFGVGIETIKYYRKTFAKKQYDLETIKEKFNKYNFNFNSKGLIKQIKCSDENLYNSIFELTKNQYLQSNKFTERIYRLFNNYSEDKIEQCKYCKNPLKFYTYELGYGNSGHNICKICNHSINGVSLISQKLFWSIYNLLNFQEKQFCKFSELNIEKKIYITNDDKCKLLEVKNKLNKNCYFIDFIFNNKIIEFDGTYYHKDKDKDIAKDKFLNLKGYEVLHIDELEYKNYPEQILNKCIQFLKA